MTDVRGRVYLPDGEGPFLLIVMFVFSHQNSDKLQAVDLRIES